MAALLVEENARVVRGLVMAGRGVYVIGSAMVAAAKYLNAQCLPTVERLATQIGLVHLSTSRFRGETKSGRERSA